LSLRDHAHCRKLGVGWPADEGWLCKSEGFKKKDYQCRLRRRKSQLESFVNPPKNKKYFKEGQFANEKNPSPPGVQKLHSLKRAQEGSTGAHGETTPIGKKSQKKNHGTR